jgi:hypothetical protein
MLFSFRRVGGVCDWLENQIFERRGAGTFLRSFPRIKRTEASLAWK